MNRICLMPVSAVNWKLILSSGLILSLFIGGMAVSGCRSTPGTSRKQLMLVPEKYEMKQGARTFKEILKEKKLSTNPRFKMLVERVGRRIAEVANRPDYEWEFKVVESSEKNAFALPGGKVCVYEGLLPVCQNEAGLAVVMAHEVAHVLARHGSERSSQKMVSNSLQGAIFVATMENLNQSQQENVMFAYETVSEYGAILPYSRKHESEADEIGLMLMAKAGYDPSAAVEFWERFAAEKESQSIEFLSTHPSDARRAADLRQKMPEALETYRQWPRKLGLGEPIEISRAKQYE